MTQVTERSPAPTIDTSRMSEDKARAVELAEDAREDLETKASFAASLFMGRHLWSRIHPFPAQQGEDLARCEAFLAKVGEVLADVDADETDRTGRIPEEIIDRLRAIGALGIKIPQKYGGQGQSQTTYTRTALLVGSHCANMAALISAHQSIGVPNPLMLFGSEEQKARFLPGLAKGELSAFALTEVAAGSDPARLETTAEPDGDHYVLNGTKLWCTGGTHAKWLVVMAKTPAVEVRGKKRDQISAFIVDASTPGLEVSHECQFMGHRAIYNAALTLTNVRVPKENLLGGEGKGLRVAFTTLNTGRLTLPAAATGMGKRCLEIVRRWANEREQWGAPVGRHPAIADKIARIAASLFAMESMTLLTSGIVDRKTSDFRVEAAICKLWCTERAWEVVNETMQIRGGRGYETTESLAARGETPDPVERFLRDSRITTLFEGSSEILRCMAIAREGLDQHAKISAEVMNSRLGLGKRAVAALKSSGFYAPWYLSLWLPSSPGLTGVHPALADHVRWAARGARVMARRLFHQMVRLGMALEQRQLLLGRFVDVATELFAVSATCSRAQHLLSEGRTEEEVLPLVAYLRHDAARRIDLHYRGVGRNNDLEGERLAAAVLDGRFRWLEEGAFFG